MLTRADEPAQKILRSRLSGRRFFATIRRTPAARGSVALLEASGIILSFRGVNALSDVSISVDQGTIHAIVGPNGAGKTSLLNCISGVYRPQRGTVAFDGRDISRLGPSERTRLGIARTFQNIALFRGMTVLDNLLIGRHLHQKIGVLGGGIYFGPGQREEIAHRKLVEDVIDFLEIQHIRKKVVGTLAYGLQKRVELARALALEPKLLLLDEPMAGMNAEEKEDMARFILEIHEERGTTMVMIEHDMGVVMELSNRITVLNFGERIAVGPPEEIQKNREVQDAYLGEQHELEVEA
jgi:branched-chain amino acid transport system ATP-binding protein